MSPLFLYTQGFAGGCDSLSHFFQDNPLRKLNTTRLPSLNIIKSELISCPLRSQIKLMPALVIKTAGGLKASTLT